MKARKEVTKVLDCQEYKEIIAAHVDGYLSFEEGLEVQSHIERCPNCAQKFLWETRVSNAFRGKLTPILASRALRERVLEQLEEPPKQGIFAWSYLPQGLVVAFALLLMVGVSYVTWRAEAKDDLFADAIAQYRTLAQGMAEARQPTPALTASARVLDLSPWGYALLAKQTRQLKDREGQIFIYQGPNKEYLLAQEFDGADFPPTSDARALQASSRQFVVYGQADVNLIAWKEKNILCLIAGNLPQEKLLGLAQQIAARG
ncbi:MAG: zf-HC2 domain-containing protein [Deltaproteobacteria bacterium]|nr:zf-HC2 domain-containing protein [Deltaproteobacteria bacterium]